MKVRVQYWLILLLWLASFPGCFGTHESVSRSERSILRHVGKLFDAANTIDFHGYYVMAGQRVSIDKTDATSEEVKRILFQAFRSQGEREVLDSMKVMTVEPVTLHAGMITVYFKTRRPDQSIAKLELYDWGSLSITDYDKVTRVWQLRGEPMEFMKLFEELSRKTK